MIHDGAPDWARYADLADDIAIPTIGVRVLAYVRDDGSRGTTWCLDADDEQVYLMIGVLEEVKRQMLAMIEETEEK